MDLHVSYEVHLLVLIISYQMNNEHDDARPYVIVFSLLLLLWSMFSLEHPDLTLCLYSLHMVNLWTAEECIVCVTVQEYVCPRILHNDIFHMRLSSMEKEAL